MSFGSYLIYAVQSCGLISNLYFKQLYIWLIVYVLSDFLFFGFVSSCFLLFKAHLYKYAYFKSIACTMLLIFNFVILEYGAYIIAKLPTDL